jgi:hypothetical protein
MTGIIAALVCIVALAWFLRRLFPALFAAVFVLAVPVWLVGGLLLDLLRRPLAFLRPLGLARLVGVVLVLPLLPFIFVWSFFAELFRPTKASAPAPAGVKPPTPMQAAARRSADVIDLAAWQHRRRRDGKAK